MIVHHQLDNLPAFKNAVLTIGTFDGVHAGHRQIIDKMKEEAAIASGETVIITFHPHPRKVVNSAILGIRLINTLEERIELLASHAIDHLVIVPFTGHFANQTADEYVNDFLISKFHPHTIIIGYDHRFGKDRLGDYRLLEKYSRPLDYQITEIPKHILENISISSTNIREAILHTDTTTANKLLGYDFFFSGIVVDGDKLGRQLGYPTANIHVQNEEKITPGNGIYAVYAQLKEHNVFTSSPIIKGMMSIGFRPTVEGKRRVIEVNLFDFNQEIYGRELRVYVKKYLREEIKFDSLELLVKQIDQDKLDSVAALDR